MDPGTPWTSVTALPAGHLPAVAAIRRTVRRLRPDVVHAHSSWAGFHSRLLELRCPVVYEPHCFKFDDPGASPLARWAYRTAERVLARHTAAFGTLSQHEAALMRGLVPSAQTVRLENVPSIAAAAEHPSFGRQRDTIVMIGRLVPQKDPEFFLRTVAAIRERDPGLRPVWVGDGAPHYREMLEASGVEVTGWLGPEEVRARLVDAVYVHTAAYEGLPLSILDAAAANAPIAARAILSVRDLPIVLESTPETLAEAACLLSRPGHRQNAALRGNASIRRAHSLERLGASLSQLYEAAA